MHIDPNDGMPCGEVGVWAKVKHDYLRRYVKITSATRRKHLGQGTAGATFIDLFCGAGRSRIRDSDDWIDGSALVAWRASQESSSQFTSIFVADKKHALRQTCCTRPTNAGAQCREVPGDAAQAAAYLANNLNPSQLHLFFVDPYSLGALDFRIFRALSKLRRVDFIVHVSAMDLQRNLPGSLSNGDDEQFDRFAPGWREAVKPASDPFEMRSRIVEHWRSLVSSLGVHPSTHMKLVKSDQGQRLYWLVIVSKHPLAQTFWEVAANPEGQGRLF